MTVRQAYEYGLTMLEEFVSQNEAKARLKIIFEDLYNITNLSDTSEFNDADDFIENILIRMLGHEPTQYITGRADFYGLRLKVDPHVLIPRPETEELVHLIVSDHKKSLQLLDIVDIGTGSGCIALAIKSKIPKARLHAIDASLDAVNMATINSRKLKLALHCYRFDFLDRSYWDQMGKFHIIVSNPPYINRDQRHLMDRSVKEYEPEMALFPSGDDPLIFYKAISDFAVDHLHENGWIYVEINEFIAEQTAAIFSNCKLFNQVEVINDLQNKPRMIRVH